MSQSHWSFTVLGNKPKKFDFVHQTVSRREARAGWARDGDSKVESMDYIIIAVVRRPLQKGAVLAIYTSYTSIIQYNLLFLVLAIYTSYTV